MKNHCTDPVPLEQLAERFQISKYYFLKLFCRETGVTPHQYLVCCRIREAKRLLSTTGKPLSRIAEQSGFSSESHLIAQFRRRCGMTPGQYRKLHWHWENTTAG